MKSVIGAALALIVAVGLAAGALALDEAQRLGQPWDAATLRQPSELKHRLRAVLSGLTSPLPPTDDMVPIAHTDLPPLGVNTFLEQEVEETTVRRSLEMIRAGGFRWIRQQFAWYEIEVPSKGRFVDTATGRSSWEKYDRIVDLAAEYGLRVLVRIDTVPAWARPAGSTFTHPPSNIQDYADFVSMVAARYRGKVRYYQLWNEPNLSFEWGNRSVSASDFVPLLQAGYTAVKRSDPEAVVVAPALAPTIDRGPANRNDTLFLREMYEAGAKDYFDVMSTMAYGLLSGPDDRRLDAFWQVNFSRSLLLRQIMVENGDSHKPIWFSEVAWNALPDWFAEKPMYGRVTEDQQARYTLRGLTRMQEQWPWAGIGFVWFFRRPTDSEKDQQFYYFRLVEPDFRPLPVYTAIKQAAGGLRVVHKGWHAPTHWAVDLSGDWRTLPGPECRLADLPAAMHCLASQQAGATARFVFQGTRLTLVAAGPGRLYVDVPTALLPRDQNGRAYLDLPAQSVRVDLARYPTAAIRQAELSADNAEIIVQGIIVENQRNFPVALLWAAAVYCVLWGAAWRVRR